MRQFAARLTDNLLNSQSDDGLTDSSACKEWRGGRSLCIAMALLFFLKFAAFALCITPFWDIPDESGHYSYVESLSHGHYPVLGKARIARDVTDSWIAPDAHQGYNWIAQHPPLFYTIAAPAVATTRALGGDFRAQVHSARLVSSFIGALAVLGLAAFLTLATGRVLLGMAGAIFIGATPMFTQLASGVTHDTLVACTAAWGLYWYVRWIRSTRPLHALLCAFLVGMCCMTKITGLTLAIPVFMMIAARILMMDKLSRPGRTLAWIGVVWLVMFLPTALWVAHNLVHFHKMFPDAGLLQVYPSKPNDVGFLQYMGKYPIWQIVLLSFFALIGWMGTLPGNTVTVQANGLLAQFFTASVLFGSLLAIFHTLRPSRETGREWAWVVALGVIAATICLSMSKYGFATVTCIALFTALLWTGITALRSVPHDSNHAWLALTGFVAIMFFSTLYYHHIWTSYTEISKVKALHGRYFYPVMPFMALIMLWPLRRGRWPVVALFSACAALVISDGFFLHFAFEMYGKFQ